VTMPTVHVPSTSRPKRADPTARVVVHVVLSLNVGGLERVVLRLLERIDRSRYAPIVLALEEPGALAWELERLDVPLRVMPRRQGLDPRLVWDLAAFLIRERVDLVHTHNPAPHLYGALGAAVAAARAVSPRRGPRVIHTKHGRNQPGSPRKVLVNRVAAAFTDRMVAVGRDTRNVIVDIERVEPSKVVTIANGIDVDQYKPGGDRLAALARLGLGECGYHVGCVARLSPEKDHATLLRAFAELRRVRPDARLTLIGDGPCRQALEALALQLRIQGDVVFAGMRSDIAETLAAFDTFALGSVTEGISLTLIEAASAGLPIVATRVGGNAEIVRQGETGLLVPPGDFRALAEGLAWCAGHPSEARSMGARGRMWAVQRFGVAEMARRYEGLYDEVLGIAGDPGSL
jgi:sugar transferase (PEP-CTERM/EpsH1 system associated)